MDANVTNKRNKAPSVFPPGGAWGCIHGCDVRTVICKHIAETLPDCDRRNVPTKARQDETENAYRGFYQSVEISEESFRALLDEHDLELIEVDFLVERFFYDWTYARIAKKHRCGSTAMRDRILAILSRLRKQGFSLPTKDYDETH